MARCSPAPWSSSRSEFALTNFELGWAVTSHTLTATLVDLPRRPAGGSLRPAHACCASRPCVFAVSAIVAAAAQRASPMLIVARLLCGLGVGAVLVAAPMYIAEISPPARARPHGDLQPAVHRARHLRWRSSATTHRAARRLPVRWLASCISPTGTGAGCSASASLPAVLYLFALLFVPESPRWLAMHGRFDAARRILTRAHGETLAERELAEVRRLARARHAQQRRHAARSAGCRSCAACCSSACSSASCSRSPASTRCSPMRP